MSKLIVSGNIALFQYPPVDSPDFDFDKEGVLFITGYTLNLMNSTVGCAKRFELGLKNFKVFGEYNKIRNKIKGDMSKLLSNFDNYDNILVLKFDQ